MEEIKDYSNIQFNQDQINFSEENNVFHVDSEQIKVYISPSVQLKNADNIENRSISDFIKELAHTGMLTVYKAGKSEDKDNQIKYYGITANYFYLFLCEPTNTNNEKTNEVITNYNLSILDVLTGKTQIVQTNIANRSKRLKIKSQYGLYIVGRPIDDAQESYYQDPRFKLFNKKKSMSEEQFRIIGEVLRNFFSQDIQKADAIPIEFNKNIINTIHQVNEAEKRVEEDEANAGACLYYDGFELISNETVDSDITFLLFHLNETSSTFNLTHAETYTEGTNIELLIKDNKLVGRIEEIDDTNEFCDITISFRQQFSQKDVLLKGEIKLRPNLTQYKVRKDVLGRLNTRNVESTYMYDTFSNFETKPLIDCPKEIEDFAKAPDEKGNVPPLAQVEAIKKGICSEDVELILGPPGTGKTTVITKLVRYFVSKKQRVLVSSKNNAAVDNVLERLPNDFNIIRIGSNENKVSPKCREFLAKNRLKDSQEHISKSTSEAIDVLQTCINNIPELIEKIDTDITQRTEIEKYRSEIDKIKNSSDYLKALKDYQSAVEKYNRYIRDKELSKDLNKYVSEYKKLNIFAKLREGLLGIIIFIYQSITNKSINKKIATSANEVAKYQAILKTSSTKIEEYENNINDILNNRIRFTAEDLKQLADINIEIARKGSEEDLTITKLQELKEEIKKINFESLISIIEDWKKETSTTGNRILTDILAEDSNVVGATCIGINSNKQFANLKFDITILDESGQIQIQDAIVPLTRSRKNILLGDHNQIPPQAKDSVIANCKDVEAPELLTDSFFEYLYNNMKNSPNVVNLDSQFRMPEVLANLVGWKFYDNKYYSPLAKNDSSRGVVVPNTTKPLIIIDTSNVENRFEINKDDSYSNKYEARIIAKLLSKIFANSDCLIKDKGTDHEKTIKPYDLVGVIAPYKKQIQTIREEVKKEKIECGKEKIGSYINDMVATLDSFQGQERPLIIFDFTRSSNKKPTDARVGFLKELRRLNVAFTRSTKQLVIIGDMKYLTTCEYIDIDPKNTARYKSEIEFSEFIGRTFEAAEKFGHIIPAEEIING